MAAISVKGAGTRVVCRSPAMPQSTIVYESVTWTPGVYKMDKHAWGVICDFVDDVSVVDDG